MVKGEIAHELNYSCNKCYFVFCVACLCRETHRYHLPSVRPSVCDDILACDTLLSSKTALSLGLFLSSFTLIVARDTVFIYLQIHIFILLIFSSPEHKVLKVSFCDRLLSVVRCQSSVINICLLTL